MYKEDVFCYFSILGIATAKIITKCDENTFFLIAKS